MLLACQNISKAFGTKEVLKDINFHVNEKEKIAIVGINGSGKTTLLKIIMGEESAYDMGADSFKVFMTVTLPLIKDSFLSGLVTAFVRSITAISAIILLVTPQFLLITVQINEFAEKGSYSLACAFATILIIITYGAVLLMNLFTKHFGTSKKLKEVD